MSLYDVPIDRLDGTPADLAELQDKAVLVVNVASKCGLTPQYEGLERLQERYADQGFTVARRAVQPVHGPGAGHGRGDRRRSAPPPTASPSRCSRRSRSTATAATRSTTSSPPRADADGDAGDIRWNFEKFLVVARRRGRGPLPPTVEPEADEVVAAIEANLPA